MATLMILGGSNCQRNALKTARRLGHKTVLIDYYAHPPAAKLADIHCQISTFDIEGCIAAAREHCVDGIFTIGTDQPVYTAAMVAAQLGLPSPIQPKTALAVTNKRVMKAILRRAGIPTAEYRLIGRGFAFEELTELGAPYVLKPVDSQGQRGVFKVESPQEVRARLEETLSYSREERALVEKYYQSDEITFSGWVRGGVLWPLTVTDRALYDDPCHIGICIGHRFPTVYMQRNDEILALARRIVQAFGIEDGPLYIQMLIGNNGILVNELACRIGGAFEDVFIPYISGFDILEAVISEALGAHPDMSALKNYDFDSVSKKVSVQLLFCRPGKVHALTPLTQLRALGFVLDVGYNYAPGQMIPPTQNATARFGHAVLACNDGHMQQRIEQFYRSFYVLDENGDNMVLPGPVYDRMQTLYGEGENA